MNESPGRLDDLLSIDVDSELRKLPVNAFAVREEYVVELIRSAVLRGAGTVWVCIGLRRVVVADDGKPLSLDTLAAAAQVFDRTEAADRRHEALSALTAGGSLGLLAAWAPGPRRVRVTSPEGALTVSGGQPRLEARPGVGVKAGDPVNTVELTRFGKPARERECVCEMVRHAAVRVLLEGRLVSRLGAEDALVREALPAPASGTVWVPASGEACRLHLLRNGIRHRLAARTGARSGLVYHAAVETGCVPERDLARLVEAAAAALYARLAAVHARRPERRERVEELLFRHARITGDTSLAGSAPLFLTATGDRVSLAEIRDAGSREALYAVDLRARRRVAAPPGALLLRLGPRQREFLTGAGVALRPPPSRARGPAIARGLAAFWTLVTSAAATVTGGRGVRPEELSEGERQLVALLQEMVDTGRLRVPAAGRGNVRVTLSAGGMGAAVRSRTRAGQEQLVLRREHRLVRMAAAAVLRNRANVHLAAAALVPDGPGRQ
jgi:hypothetical protein